MYVINTLAPVFLVIALGALLRRSGLLSADLVGGITRLAYWVGLPALLFYKIATAPQIDFAVGGAFVISLIGTLACRGASYALAALLGTGGNAFTVVLPGVGLTRDFTGSIGLTHGT